jgi:hypothetical protein
MHTETNYEMQDADMQNAGQQCAGILPRSYVIDQPYCGILPLAEGLHRGVAFPNIILPQRKEER